MSKASALTKKLPIILFGILIGLGTTMVFDKYRESQSEKYISEVMLTMQSITNGTGNQNLSNHLYFTALNKTTVKKLDNLGTLINYSILSSDANLDFTNENGLHSVATVKTSATYTSGITELTFDIRKKNGRWSISGIKIANTNNT